ncbi:MAG TPA: STAS domain-containing protein [Steroidobacteraceae bacterium]|nr:STAS domain-containing protein [Steroidobacteraceae bacterium]
MSGTPAANGRGAATGAFRLVPAADGHYAAEGALTFATARRARELGARLWAGNGAALEVDCRGVTTCDSAGLAVLLDWLGAARRRGRALHYTNLPPGLTALARISEVEALLGRGV